MEMHQIRYFIALCDELNFTRAAQRCKVAQPSLTVAIKALEDHLGGPLFRRRPQVALTELGKALLPALQEIVIQAEIVRATAKALAGPHQQLQPTAEQHPPVPELRPPLRALLNGHAAREH